MVLSEIKLISSDSSMDFNLSRALVQENGTDGSDKLLRLIFASKIPSYTPTCFNGDIDCPPGLFKPLERDIEVPASSFYPANGCPPRRANVKLASWRVKMAKELMIKFMDQGRSIEQVANECAISRSHFSRAFKSATGLAPHDWLRREKIHRAEELLRTRRFPISHIAHECGFSDQSYFTRVFRQLNGVTPRRWQTQYCPVLPTNVQA